MGSLNHYQKNCPPWEFFQEPPLVETSLHHINASGLAGLSDEDHGIHDTSSVCPVWEMKHNMDALLLVSLQLTLLFVLFFICLGLIGWVAAILLLLLLIILTTVQDTHWRSSSRNKWFVKGHMAEVYGAVQGDTLLTPISKPDFPVSLGFKLVSIQQWISHVCFFTSKLPPNSNHVMPIDLFGSGVK